MPTTTNENYFSTNQKKTIDSNLYQVIDVIQEDVSGSATRRKYQTFVTGGVGPGVTSSLYQTIYDQDFTLQTANPVMDMTVGLFHFDNGTVQRTNLVTRAGGYARAGTTHQLSFGGNTMMMREKINVYRQYASYLLGNPNSAFSLGDSSGVNWPAVEIINSSNETLPTSATTASQKNYRSTSIIDAAVFINVKRLFARDKIRPQTFAMRLYHNSAKWRDSWDTSAYHANNYRFAKGTATNLHYWFNSGASTNYQVAHGGQHPNISLTSEQGVQIIADLDTNIMVSQAGGEVGLLCLASNKNLKCGLIFYDAGIVVLNLGMSNFVDGSSLTNISTDTTNTTPAYTAVKEDWGLGGDLTRHRTVFDPRDSIRGAIGGMNDTVVVSGHSDFGQIEKGEMVLGDLNSSATGPAQDNNNANPTFYPDLLVSSSIDDIVDHISSSRFSSGSLTACAFQNTTSINSTLYFCRAEASQFNHSTNPTFTEGMAGLSSADRFTYITTVTLNDADGQTVAIAKLNRPIEKSEESEVTIRVRLDF